MASQLLEMGYRHLAAASLKPKHVESLVERWQAEGLAVGTIKNRMAELRWWAEKIGKQNVIARDNDHYGIGNRQYVTNVSKARQLTGGELARITDPYTAMSLRLNGISHWIMWEMASLFEHVGTVQDGILTLSKPRTVLDRPDAKPLVVSRGEVRFLVELLRGR